MVGMAPYQNSKVRPTVWYDANLRSRVNANRDADTN